MYNVYFTVVEIVCQFLYTPVQSTAASVYLCQSVSHYYVFFDAFVCTLHFACIQIVKRRKPKHCAHFS